MFLIETQQAVKAVIRPDFTRPFLFKVLSIYNRQAGVVCCNSSGGDVPILLGLHISSACTSGLEVTASGNSSGCSPPFLTAFPACTASLCFSFGECAPFFNSFSCLHCFSFGDLHLQLSRFAHHPPRCGLKLCLFSFFFFFALDPISSGQNLMHQLLIPVFNHLPLTKKNLDSKNIPSFLLFVNVL